MDNERFGELVSFVNSMMGRQMTTDEVSFFHQLVEKTHPTTDGYINFKVVEYNEARLLSSQGSKIEAIKTLRQAFTPTFGLKDANDIVKSWSSDFDHSTEYSDVP